MTWCGGTVLFWLWCLAITNTGVRPVVEAAVVAVNGTMADRKNTTLFGVVWPHSLLVALGCFWCAEQALEQYGPGVLEAVSGYAGGSNDHPSTFVTHPEKKTTCAVLCVCVCCCFPLSSDLVIVAVLLSMFVFVSSFLPSAYRNHPGHYEVIEIRYDPAKTSYAVLVEYAYRNMDPFNGQGQFCDIGASYYPAIFYGSDDERGQAERVLDEIVATYGWDITTIAAPILPRPTQFWPAEYYHQDYYLKNPAKYGYYKNGCGRTQRLKEVWGDDEYACYHDPWYTCFGGANATIINTQNDEVRVESNIKAAPDEIQGLLIPPWLIIILSLVGGAIALTGLVWILRRNY